ncbi:MAG: thioredoxin family protein [Bacteroidales bacterium]|jgi:thiol-disulfide isomerase/thioredoxin|nr:thioredoxin family protein [Bacteroidales bacterium]
MKLIPKMLLLFIFIAMKGALNAQEINQYIMDTVRDREVLIDFVNREVLQTGEFAEYYSQEYDSYAVDQEIINHLKTKLEDLEIVVVLASWCIDSKIQVPRFLKLLDAIGFSEEQLMMIGVDSQKKARDLDIDIYEVERVPTFIFYRNGKTIGRIVENPTKSLEADMQKIVR